jgi:tetratricopeptide (TPR) repeat protein
VGDGSGPLPRRWFDVALDALAVAGVVALLAVPLAAVLSVSAPVKATDAGVVLPPLPRGRVGKPLSDVPVFTAGSEAAADAADSRVLTDPDLMAGALDRQFRAAFGPGGDAGLLEVARRPERVASVGTLGSTADPLRFPAVEQVLDRVLGTGAVPASKVPTLDDLAGLLALAAAGSPSVPGSYQLRAPWSFPNAARIAYALYDRASHASQRCVPQLGRALLVSTNTPATLTSDSPARAQYDENVYQATVSEFHRAAGDCPDDPTPLWLLGQFQSLSRHPDAARATFTTLERSFPRSALGWSGEADARMRAAYRVDVRERYSAASDFALAQALYRRAEGLAPREPGLRLGEARAAFGLRRFRKAAEIQLTATRAMSAAVRQPFEGRLVMYLEQARRFSEAADHAASRPEVVPPPAGRGLVAGGTDVTDGVGEADALGPISYGAVGMRPVHLEVISPPDQLAFTDTVTDLSFIPRFRPDVLTVTGNRGRDLVLAGRTDEARALAAGADTSSYEDPASTRLLGGVADYESGAGVGRAARVVDAADAARDAGSTAPGEDLRPARLLDADQNMWRFAGDLARARHAAGEWFGLAPEDPRAADRLGEVEYLLGDYGHAASHFAQAAAAVAASGPGDVTRADELLKQGTALEMDGKLGRARATLRRADEAAAGSIPVDFDYRLSGPEPRRAVLDSYNARLQAGDTELRDSARKDARFEAAARHYEAAREREGQLGPVRYPADSFTKIDVQMLATRREPVFRPEVLENNQALVLVHLGREREAYAAIRRAVASDPKNPYFLANRAYVETKLGHPAAAIRSYRASLADGPVLPWAANNLGVLLADEGHLSRAAEEFRRAVAADAEYTTGEFNLGLALDRMGPAHVLEAQGELAAAARRDPELRERDHELVTDDETYITTLDLSKPLPPNWQLTTSEQRAPITVATVVFALLLFRVFRAFVEDKASEKATEGTLRAFTKRVSGRADGLGRRVPAAFALAAVVAVFVYPLARSSGATRGEFLLLGSGVAVATFAFMRLRSAIARRSAVGTRHSPCLPAVVVGGAAALVGVGFAPMPATRSDEPIPHHARWWGTGLLGALTVILLLVGRFTAVPFATQLGVVCLVMTSSALVPVEPYDGVLLEEGHRALFVAVALAVVAALHEFGVL